VPVSRIATNRFANCTRAMKRQLATIFIRPHIKKPRA
jgi:hypothetical protein